MGFLSFLKKKEEPAEEPPAPMEEDVRAEDLPGWFSQAFGERLASARKEALGTFRDIAASLGSVEKASRKLEKAEFETGDKTYAAVNMIKDDYVKKLKKAIHCVSREPGSDYASLLKFHSSAREAIGELLDIGPRQAILLSRYFSSEMKTVVAKIKEAKEALDRMGSFLKGEGSIIRVNDDLESLLGERGEALKALEEARAQLKESERRSSGLSEEISSAESRLNDFESSDGWKRHISLRSELEEAESEASGIEEAVRSELSVTKRPLKKFSHVTGQKAGFLAGDLFAGFSENPASFSSLLGKMLETDIGLKGKEREKLEALSGKLPSLEERAGRHMLLKEKAAGAREKLESCRALKEKEALESAHRDALSRRGRLEEAMKKERERISQLSEEADGFRKKAERLINNGTDMKIRLSQQRI